MEEWVFSGIGTYVITLIIGMISGGSVGYRIGVSKKMKQSQKAGDFSNQVQVGRDMKNG